MELAFDRLGLEVVRVSHEPRNENSERAISRYVDRVGGRREGVERNVTPYDGGTVHDEVRYAISQAEWLAATDGGTSVL